MPSAPPDGEPAPADGSLPAGALAGVGVRPVRALHPRARTARSAAATATSTPTCRRRSEPAGTRESWLGCRVVRDCLGPPGAAATPHRRLDTVFFGGGTPTLVPPDDARLGWCDAVDAEAFGLAPGAEVTTEANPESVYAAKACRAARRGGINRISFGMQSAVPHVLAALDRRHTPGRVAQAVELGAGCRVRAGEPRPHLRRARREPTPTGRRASRRRSRWSPDHVSAYALVVEEGTRLARQVRPRARSRAPDDDVLAAATRCADEAAGGAGLPLVRGEQLVASRRGMPAQPRLLAGRLLVGHRARRAQLHRRCGIRDPLVERASRPPPMRAGSASGRSPAAGRELLDAAERQFEQLLLLVRLRPGVADDWLDRWKACAPSSWRRKGCSRGCTAASC